MNHRIYRNVSLLCLLFPLWALLGGCNNEDDLIEIFTGKTWKLARLTTEGSKAPFLADLWSGDKEYQNSINALQQENTFTLTFEGNEVNGELMGTRVAIRGVRVNIPEATWTADGKNQSLTISGKANTTESDPLAKEFIKGVLNVYKYEGDSGTLTLYYKDGQATKVLGFKPVK